MKYIRESGKSLEQYWAACKKNGAPYITISDHGEYEKIFFDVTDFEADLDLVSDSVRSIYLKYLDFFLVPAADVGEFLDQYYFFSFLVKKGHGEKASEQLHDYLISRFLKP